MQLLLQKHPQFYLIRSCDPGRGGTNAQSWSYKGSFHTGHNCFAPCPSAITPTSPLPRRCAFSYVKLFSAQTHMHLYACSWFAITHTHKKNKESPRSHRQAAHLLAWQCCFYISSQNNSWHFLLLFDIHNCFGRNQ